MSQTTPPPPAPAVSVRKALWIGHLTITLPEVAIMLGFIIAGRTLFDAAYSGLFIIGGFIVAWQWWAQVTPRWRRWALRGGAPVERLRKLATMTGITWPKGPVFDQDEPGPKAADPETTKGSSKARP